MSNKKGIFRTGTSGIVVPGNKQSFPVAFQHTSRLHYYGSLFNSVEINSTFYRIPMGSTLEKWSDDVPDDFRFTLKLWKEITHVKQLKTDLTHIATFLNAADHIADKKGCLLIQFPGSITDAYEDEVEQLLEKLQELDRENRWHKAIEFRSETWYTSATYNLLDKYNGSLVLHDMPKSRNEEVDEAAPFMYCRFHGTRGDYKGDYTPAFLEAQAEKIRSVLNTGKDVYAYFNNTMGNAYQNALDLKAMVEE